MQPFDSESVPKLYDAPYVRVAYQPNPFNLDERIIGDLDWAESKTLADYLEGLPEDVTWYVWWKADFVDPSLWGEIVPEQGDLIVVVPELEGGGGGGKDILRLVAFVAVAVFAAWAAPLILGPGAAAWAVAGLQAGITIAGSVLINVLLPPPTPEGPGNMDPANESPTYGLDGPQNTNVEDVVVPVVYGEMVIGGNIVNSYTVNVGDTQHLYQQHVLSEGQIEGIVDVKVNDQPWTNYQGVDWKWRSGTGAQTAIPWFANTINQNHVGSTLTQAWTYYTTSGPVDQFRLDVTFPRGLVETNNEAKKLNRSVTFEVEYSIDGGVSWRNANMSRAGQSEYDWYDTGTTTNADARGVRAQVTLEPLQTGTLSNYPPEHPYTVELQYRVAGQTSWSRADIVSGTMPTTRRQLGDSTSWVRNATSVSVAKTGLPANTYETRVVVSGQVASHTVQFAALSQFQSNNAGMTVTAKQRNPKRASFMSEVFDENVADIRVRRTNTESTDSLVSDQAILSDVAEILLEDISYIHTATGALKVKFTDQLNRIPTVVWQIKGVKLRHYDAEGNPGNVVWSNNPALVALDILTNPRYGAGMVPWRIDWGKFYEWRLYCESKGLTFNGVFDFKTNVWEALQKIFRVGHAQLILSGTKYSLAIEKPDTPVMMFGSGNMEKGSFSIEWLNRTDHANEIEVIFVNKDKGFRRDQVRVIDWDAHQRGEVQKTSRVDMLGVTKTDNAWREGHLQMAFNKYIRAQASWSSPIESIACTVGDLVYVNHDMPDWGVSGRLKPGSTATTLRLDRAVPAHYDRVLVHFGVLNRGTFSITRPGNGIVSVAGGSVLAGKSVARMQSGTFETAVTGRIDDTTFIVENDSGLGSTATIYSTDAVEEVACTVGGADNDELSVSLNEAPPAFANFAAGTAQTIKRIFRITSISGDHEQNRQLSGIEYNESVYLDPENAAPNDLTGDDTSTLGHVTILYAQEELIPDNDSYAIALKVFWAQPQRGEYAGADIYVSREDEPFVNSGAAWNDTQFFQLPVTVGENVSVKIVAFNKAGLRTNFETAPVLHYTVAGDDVPPGTPTNLTAQGDFRSIILNWSLPVDLDLAGTEIWESSINDLTTAVKVATAPSTNFLRGGLAGLETRYYWVRAVDVSGNLSDFNSNIGTEATTVQATHDDLVQQIVDESILVPTLLEQINANSVNAGELLDYYALMDGLDLKVDGYESRVTTLETFKDEIDTGTSQLVIDSQLQLAKDETRTAAVAQIDQAYLGPDGAIAQQVDTVRTEVDDKLASLEIDASTIDGLKAQYTVKIDNNGYVAGFGLASDATDGPPQSEFVILADRFAMAQPNIGGAPEYPFVIGQAADGTSRVSMNSAFITEIIAAILKSPDNKFRIDLANKFISIEV